jgi:hypothetical protein
MGARTRVQRPDTKINEIRIEVNLMPPNDQSLGPWKEIEFVVPRHLVLGKGCYMTHHFADFGEL